MADEPEDQLATRDREELRARDLGGLAAAHSLEAGLARADLTLPEALTRFAETRRVDLSGLPPGAAARFLAAAQQALGPIVVLTGDGDAASRMVSDLSFFAPRDESGTRAEGDLSETLLFPALDTTPFLEVAPDRRTAMDRLAVLFHLARELPWRFLVAPGAALTRRVAPREAVLARSMLIEREGECEREELLDVLSAGGYLRVPVAEDPGTYAVRGGIIDVFPPHASYPARIDLDDYLVLSIKRFDPDDQRTIDEIDRLFVHPVRDTLLSGEDRDAAIEKVRALYDEANYPTTETRAVLDDLRAGRIFYGLDALLPAFYERLETIFDYVPADVPVVLYDPTAVSKGVDMELHHAGEDRDAKDSEGHPVYPLEKLYALEDELAEHIGARRHAIIHRLAVLGRASADESALAAFESVEEDALKSLGAEDQKPLVAELRARRQELGDDALKPVAERCARWLDQGLRVVFTARTTTQAERLVKLLQQHEIPVEKNPQRFDPSTLDQGSRLKAKVVIGELQDGFAWATESLVVVTESEIFGTRTRRTQKARRRKQKASAAFLEDLRELKVGDYIVHADHGVGKYLGIVRKTVQQSASEKLRGDPPKVLEVLSVEYSGGDKLFLPVTRLGQIKKFAGREGATQKLDKLGGSTFNKKKAKVRKAVQQMADELLKLYAARAAASRPALPPAERAYSEFEATFPFEETPDQARAIDDVLSDFERNKPMDRLVCGDVGFGKTEVAMRAAFRMAMSGRQVAVLCPTTVLAQQHFQGFKARMREWPLKVASLSRFTSKEDSIETTQGLKEGTVDIVIGTHRLLSKDIHFKDLGLTVVDEEQRFGVAHKERLKKLKESVDVLTLSATPIPRTLQMAIGGMRDLSLITTAPVDRRAVRTYACRWDDHTLKEAIGRELDRGGQVFFVYNRIEGLYERAARLQQLVPQARIAVAHGQMKEGALEAAMTDFVDGQFDVLCSTAIIESGLDIPRANTMIVDRADMFGLAQLYQLRGRVGRSKERAYCYLVTPPPSTLTDEARQRIEALERFTELGSGFQIASLDMELRGVGDLLGAEQSGNVALVGFDMFVQMLEEAVAQLRGDEVVPEIDPELNLDLDFHIPDDYVADVGLRLSFYQRFGSLEDEDSIRDLAQEMEDRFGPPPKPTLALVRAMLLKPGLRFYRALGCDATAKRVTLFLRQDTPLDPAKVIAHVQESGGRWKLTPDMKLSYRFEEDERADSIDRVEEFLRMLRPLEKGLS